MKVRRLVGISAFALALVFIAWLPLGVFEIIPFVMTLPGEPSVRVHAAAAVGCLMVAAWAFWNIQ